MNKRKKFIANGRQQHGPKTKDLLNFSENTKPASFPENLIISVKFKKKNCRQFLRQLVGLVEHN